jgi:hypothetical protein
MRLGIMRSFLGSCVEEEVEVREIFVFCELKNFRILLFKLKIAAENHSYSLTYSVFRVPTAFNTGRFTRMTTTTYSDSQVLRTGKLLRYIWKRQSLKLTNLGLKNF